MTVSTAATSARTSARGTAGSRSGAPICALPDGATPAVSLADWLEGDGERLDDGARPAVRPAERPALAPTQRARRAREPRTLGEMPGWSRRSSTTTTPCCAASPRGRSGCSRRDRDDGGRGRAALRHREHLAIVAHELRSPVAALDGARRRGPRGADDGATPGARPRDRGRPRRRAGPHRRRARLAATRAASTSARSQSSLAQRTTVAVSVAGRTRVEGDPTRLRQVLANLVANGLRHGSRVEVDVGERDGAGRRRRGRRRAGSRSEPSTRSRAARAGPARPGSGSGSRVRSPRRTAARSSSSRHRAGARASGCLCRPLPPRAEAELRLERLGARGDGAAHRRRLEHDGLATVGEHLGEEPLLRLERARRRSQTCR